MTGDWKEKVRRRMGQVDQVLILCGAYTHTATVLPPSLKSLKSSRSPTS